MRELLIIVPSRGRPQNLVRVVAAWRATDAFKVAALLFAIDRDDPDRQAYIDAGTQLHEPGLILTTATRTPMAPRTNFEAYQAAQIMVGQFVALGSAGDDHLPRTPGWAQRYLAELAQLGTGIVYGDDGYQGATLCTEWAMTADIVRALGRLIPAPVDHLYADNAVRDLGHAAGCLKHLPDVRIEHVHPAAGRAEWDEGYRRVNAAVQYRRDRAAYQTWQREQLPADAALVRALREEAR